MMCNPSTDPAVKTTLIVAPLALLNQWQLEIELKTNDSLKCLVYHVVCLYASGQVTPVTPSSLTGSNKTKKKKDLMKYDVILTTFQVRAPDS